MKTCKYCGGELIDTAKKCKHCGEWLDINCPYCEGEVSPQAAICPHCGERLTPVVNNSNNYTNTNGCSWVKTLLFLFFFGYLGGHRFYVGKTGTAVAMLLITLCLGWIFGIGFFITAIWSFVDCIYILVGKFTDSKGNLLIKKPTKTSTALICFFWGLCGYHSFYTGKIGIGFAQMFTLGGLGIWWLIDLITILTGNYRDANGNLLPNE